jgi:hypothetical protein
MHFLACDFYYFCHLLLLREFYTGWLTHWGENIATTDAASTAEALKAILCHNGSAVLYVRSWN